MRLKIPYFLELKRQQKKFTCLTAYDASFAQLMEQAGVEVLLIGDSLGMVIQGKSDTLGVSLEQMIYHTQCVSRATTKPLIMSDMPFACAYTTELAYANASRLMAEGGAQMVKLEGGEIMLKTVEFLSQRSIPVCSHLGLLPQSVYRLGGYKKQGVQSAESKKILSDGLALEQAGSDMLLLECVPDELAQELTASVNIPVIGIGAGKDCDAQVLVSYDVLGVSAGKIPSFSKNFSAGITSDNPNLSAFQAYVNAVKQGFFP